MEILGIAALALLVFWWWSGSQKLRAAQHLLAKRKVELDRSSGDFWLVVDLQEMKGYRGKEDTWIVRRNQDGTWETKMTADTEKRMRAELAESKWTTDEEKVQLAAWNRAPEDVEPQLETAWRRYVSSH